MSGGARAAKKTELRGLEDRARLNVLQLRPVPDGSEWLRMAQDGALLQLDVPRR